MDTPVGWHGPTHPVCWALSGPAASGRRGPLPLHTTKPPDPAPPHSATRTASPQGGLVAVWVERIGLRPGDGAGIESGPHIIPTVNVVRVHQMLEGKLGWPPDLVGLPHECQRVLVPLGPRRVTCHTSIQRIPVRTVRRELVVDTAGTGHEPNLGIVAAPHQAHEFRHDVAVVPRRPESVLRSHIPRGEHHKINIRSPRHRRIRRQHHPDGRVRMVVGHRVYGHEIPHIVLDRHQIPVPSHHVERAVLDLPGEQLAGQLANHLVGLAGVLEPGLWGEEMPGVGEAGADADGPQVWDHKLAAKILQDISLARGAAHAVHLEHNTSRHQSKLLLLHLQIPELSSHSDGPLLRHYYHVTILVPHHPPALSHAGVEGVDPRGGSVVCSCVPIHSHHRDAIHKIHPCLLIHGSETVLLGGEICRCLVSERRIGDRHVLLRAVGYRRSDPVLPRIPV
mmetsp:Transcript_28686/g.63232  ORF Transcript_28686/g.63232 Transcript_28686/m.63232 type:complete len:451 (-) Transcript_28686:224-1576(-)